MILLDLVQGSKEWHVTRANSFTASEAPAMMAASKYQTRNDLLKQKATGITPEVSEFQQKIFNKGHEAEAKARPVAEKIIGGELYPATGVMEDYKLLASFDGLTLMEDECWEHKLWNEDLAASVVAEDLDPHYYWQLEQQLLVSGADRCLFMCSDGTEANMRFMWYYPVEGRRLELLMGWERFEKDLENYTHEAPKAEVVATAQEQLPALVVDLVGEVRSTNLATFEQAVLARIQAVNTDLTTDQEFADAEATVKFFTKGEKELEAVKEQALAQTASIDELFKTVDMLKSEMRDKRLALNKAVKERKEAIRIEIVMKAKDALAYHISEIEAQLGGYALPVIAADFANAIKGKKTVSSLQSAADDELARAKIEVTKSAESMQENLSIIASEIGEYGFLFADKQQLIHLESNHLKAEITSRIAQHKEQERLRQEQERERIRLEEEAKARQKAEAEQRSKEAAEAAAEAEPVTAPRTQEKEAPRFTPPQQKQAELMISITQKEYDQLKQDSEILAALRGAGVDNWQGYDDAMAMLDQAA